MGTDTEPINLEDGTIYLDTGDGRWQELKWLTEPPVILEPAPGHTVEITPRCVRIDGTPVIVHEDGPRVETLGTDLYIVHIPILARAVTLNGDTHDPDATTPIYDQLVKEAQ